MWWLFESKVVSIEKKEPTNRNFKIDLYGITYVNIFEDNNSSWKVFGQGGILVPWNLSSITFKQLLSTYIIHFKTLISERILLLT